MYEYPLVLNVENKEQNFQPHALNCIILNLTEITVWTSDICNEYIVWINGNADSMQLSITERLRVGNTNDIEMF